MLVLVLIAFMTLLYAQNSDVSLIVCVVPLEWCKRFLEDFGRWCHFLDSVFNPLHQGTQLHTYNELKYLNWRIYLLKITIASCLWIQRESSVFCTIFGSTPIEVFKPWPKCRSEVAAFPVAQKPLAPEAEVCFISFTGSFLTFPPTSIENNPANLWNSGSYGANMILVSRYH